MSYEYMHFSLSSRLNDGAITFSFSWLLSSSLSISKVIMTQEMRLYSWVCLGVFLLKKKMEKKVIKSRVGEKW